MDVLCLRYFSLIKEAQDTCIFEDKIKKLDEAIKICPANPGKCIFL